MSREPLRPLRITPTANRKGEKSFLERRMQGFFLSRSKRLTLQHSVQLATNFIFLVSAPSLVGILAFPIPTVLLLS